MPAISGCRLHRDSRLLTIFFFFFLYIGTSFVQVIKDPTSVNRRIELRRVVEFVLYALTLLESVRDAMCPVIGKFLFAEDAECVLS